MVRLTPEDRDRHARKLLHPMSLKMKERVDSIVERVESRGAAGIPQNRLEGDLFNEGMGSIGTIRRHLKTLIDLDRLILYGRVYYTPQTHELHEIERVEEDSILLRKKQYEQPLQQQQESSLPFSSSSSSLIGIDDAKQDQIISEALNGLVEDGLVRVEMGEDGEERFSAIPQESHTHTMVGGLLSKKSLPGGEF